MPVSIYSVELNLKGGFSYDPGTGACYRTLDFMGFEGYRVGDDGTVWTAWRFAGKGFGKGQRVVSDVWKRMSQTRFTKRGHVMVALRGAYGFSVHALVLLAFHRPPVIGEEGRHLDGNPLNNRVENLVFGTRQENVNDRGRHGRTFRGPRIPERKRVYALTPQIRVDYFLGGMRQVDVAKAHGTNQGLVSKIIRGQFGDRGGE